MYFYRSFFGRWQFAHQKKTVSYLLSHSTNKDFLSFNRVDIVTLFQAENIVIISYGTEEDEKQILCHIYKSPATQFECHHCAKIVLCSLKLYTKCDQGPVSNSRKPRKLFGPVKPCLVHLYLKSEGCLGPKLLV